jgi:perosamine synthetase
MWARVKLKIDWSDIAFTIASSLRGGDQIRLQQELESYWSDKGDAIACFSVRSGFDLLLQAMMAEGQLAKGDEVMFSALNVKQMVRAVERLGLTPVPVDLDLSDMSPRLDIAEQAVTSKSKVFVVAHLFGARMDMAPAAAFAKRHGLLLAEDCAQAYDGEANRGSRLSDVVMFSFGPIKTKTCLGGGMFTVRRPDLLARMRTLQAAYPVQTDKDQVKRALKFAGLKVLTSRTGVWLLSRYFSMKGQNYDEGLSNAVRDVAKQKTPKQLRLRCSPTLLKLLAHRLRQDVGPELQERMRMGEMFRELLEGKGVLPAGAARYHDYWVFPAIVENPAETISALRKAGFDACDLPRSEAIAPPEGRESLRAVIAEKTLSNLIVLPCYPEMPDRALLAQAKAFCAVAQPAIMPEPLAVQSAAE